MPLQTEKLNIEVKVQTLKINKLMIMFAIPFIILCNLIR